MFYYICGELVHTDLTTAALDCSGVAYQMTVSGHTLEKITSHKGEKVKLYTHMAVREDSVELFGFSEPEELSAFRMLISVSGVGPKAAMSVLTLLSPAKFALAVATADAKQLSKAPGVGAKTSARIILELKDKISKEAAGAGAEISAEADGTGNKLSDARNTLTVLGYTRQEADAALRKIDTTKLELEDIIREALKNLLRK